MSSHSSLSIDAVLRISGFSLIACGGLSPPSFRPLPSDSLPGLSPSSFSSSSTFLAFADSAPSLLHSHSASHPERKCVPTPLGLFSPPTAFFKNMDPFPPSPFPYLALPVPFWFQSSNILSFPPGCCGYLFPLFALQPLEIHRHSFFVISPWPAFNALQVLV